MCVSSAHGDYNMFAPRLPLRSLSSSKMISSRSFLFVVSQRFAYGFLCACVCVAINNTERAFYRYESIINRMIICVGDDYNDL